jgi:hypothetical protein
VYSFFSNGQRIDQILTAYRANLENNSLILFISNDIFKIHNLKICNAKFPYDLFYIALYISLCHGAMSARLVCPEAAFSLVKGGLTAASLRPEGGLTIIKVKAES